MAQDQSLVGEQRSHKPYGVAKQTNKQKTMAEFESQLTKFLKISGWFSQISTSQIQHWNPVTLMHASYELS